MKKLCLLAAISLMGAAFAIPSAADHGRADDQPGRPGADVEPDEFEAPFDGPPPGGRTIHRGGFPRGGGFGGLCEPPRRLYGRAALGPSPRRLALELDYTAALVQEDIGLDLAGAAGAAPLRKHSAALGAAALHLRQSAANGAGGRHLRQDLAVVAGAYGQLDRALGRHGGSFALSRKMAAIESLIALLERRLEVFNAPFAEPSESPQFPGSRGRSTPIGPSPKIPVDIEIPDDMKGIGLLPPADQQAALLQRTCPVTGELLGSMGKPIKVTTGGRSVFVCCRGCVAKVRQDAQLRSSP